MPPTYQVAHNSEGGHGGDIDEPRTHPTHFHLRAQEHRNSSHFVLQPPTPTDYGETTLEEEVDHILILLVTLLPLLFAISIVVGVALLIRRMKHGSRDGSAAAEQSFSSLPTPSPTEWWRQDSLSGSKAAGLSLSMPHLLLVPSSSHSLSMPHLLAIESYYNYPSTASIMDETFQDVVDQAKIQAEVARELSHEAPPKTLKRSLSLKSLRRFRSRLVRFITFRKRRERRSVAEEVKPNHFCLSTLPSETRQQLKQIYVY